MKELIEFILNKTQESEQESVVTKEGTVKIDPEHFHVVQDCIPEAMTFIDGGNAELFSTGTLVVHLIRTAAVTIFNKKQTAQSKKEFFLVTFQDQQSIHCRSFPTQSYDILTFPLETYDHTSTAEMIRRLTELDLAIQTKGLVCLDGSFETKHPEEVERITQLSQDTIALSKTTSQATTTGRTISYALSKQKQGSWFYGPLSLLETGSTFFVKLHSASRHVFRLDTMNPATTIIAQLAQHAADPIFLGYPYGLVAVDQIARISKQEAARIQHTLLLQAGKYGKDFFAMLSATDAHTILDNIS